jgi:molybdate transport system permease protein
MNPPSDLSILWLTFGAAALSTALMFPFGLAIALLGNRRGAFSSLLKLFGLLPWVMPPTAVGFLLLHLLMPGAPLGRLLERLHLDLLFTFRAVVLSGAVVGLPFLVRAAADAFSSVRSTTGC